MRILLAYVLTPAVVPDYLRNRSIQRQQFSDATAHTSSIVVASTPLDDVPDQQLITSDLGEGPRICLAAGLNRALTFAVDEGFDWVILMDSDTILVRPLPRANTKFTKFLLL